MLNTTAQTLADIIADANLRTPEQLAETIDNSGWHGAPDDAANTAVGNYLAGHLTPNVLVWVSHHHVMVLNTHTKRVLAETTLTGALADLADFIGEDDDPGDPLGFAHLHGVGVPEPLGEADRAEIIGARPISEAEGAFLDSINHLMATAS